MKRIIYDIKILEDGEGLFQYYIVKSCYFLGIHMWDEHIGQDGKDTPFLDLLSLELYLKQIL